MTLYKNPGFFPELLVAMALSISIAACSSDTSSDVPSETENIAPGLSQPEEPVDSPDLEADGPLSPTGVVDDPGSNLPNLTSQQQLTLPGDCLLSIDVDANAYCFSGSNAELIVVEPSGNVLWSKTIPAGTTNEIVEGISVLDQFAVLLVATEESSGQYLHEIYSHTATTVDKLATIDPFVSMRGHAPVAAPRVNPDLTELATAATDESLFVAYPWYSLIPGGDPAQSSDWIFDGTLLARITLDRLSALSYRKIPMEAIVQMNVVADDSLSLDLSSGVTMSLAANSLEELPVTTQPDIINSTSVYPLMPQLYRTLQGNFVRTLIEKFGGLNDNLNYQLGEISWPCSPYSDENPANCIFTQTIGPETVSCDDGGSVTHLIQAWTEYLPGASSHRFDTEEFAFHDCSMNITGVPGLADGVYRLGGVVSLNRESGGVESGLYTMIKESFEQFLLEYPDNSIEELTGSETSEITIDQYRTRTWDISVDSYTNDNLVISDLLYNHEETSAPPNHGVRESITLSGNMTVQSTETQYLPMTFTIDPAIYGNNFGNGASVGGQVVATASDGSNALMTIDTNANNSDTEELHLQIENSSGVETVILPFSALYYSYRW